MEPVQLLAILLCAIVNLSWKEMKSKWIKSHKKIARSYHLYVHVQSRSLTVFFL